MEQKLTTKQYIKLIKDTVTLTFDEYKKDEKDISEYFRLTYGLLEELEEGIN